MNTSPLPKVTLYSDGGAAPNPGKAGYGIILCYKDIKKEFSQGYTLSTNNRMEMTGVITGLSKLKTRSEVEIYTDSQYTINGIEKGWAKKWKSNDWMRTKTEKATNYDLWKILLELVEKHKVRFHWVKGHNGHIENERCDELATLALNSDDLIEDEGFIGNKNMSSSVSSPEGEERAREIGIIENYKSVPAYIMNLSRDLRKKQTNSETLMWELLRGRKLHDLKFRRQYAFGRYIADFYCFETKLVLELDGKIHENQKEYDEIRDDTISKYGVKILRIKNEELETDITSVFEKVLCYSSPSGEVRGGLANVKKKNTNKISQHGDICGKCNTPVEKKIPKKKKLKPNQTFYYEYFFTCPGCKTNYMVPEGKRNVKK